VVGLSSVGMADRWS